MAVAFDAKTVQTTNSSATITFTHTPVGTPSAAGVAIGWVDTGGQAISSVTYGGTTCTQVGTVQVSPTSAFWKTAVFGLANPASGAQTVTVTFAAALSHGGSAVAVTVTGSDTTTCFSSNNQGGGTASQSDVTVSSISANELVIDIMSNASSLLSSYGANQTEIINTAPTSGVVLGSRKASTGTSETMTITIQGNAEWAHSAASFKISGGATATNRIFFPYGSDGTGGGVTGQNRIH